MESRDLHFDLAPDEIALREAISHGGGERQLDPLARALHDLRRPRELTRDEWNAAYLAIQEHNIRRLGPSV
ncbi:MAG TPA: hypothetical protein VH419_06345, partial [Nocardioidaceae bacterium]